MNSLELKIPPPIVGLLICAAMWGLSLLPPDIPMPERTRMYTAMMIIFFGGIVILSAGFRFLLAKTTLNAMKPRATSSLITTGVYRLTRNPMYLGLLLIIIAWTILLSSPWALIGPFAYVLYMNRFQIIPEERALFALFGADYSAYQSRVRRWL